MARGAARGEARSGPSVTKVARTPRGHPGSTTDSARRTLAASSRAPGGGQRVGDPREGVQLQVRYCPAFHTNTI